MGTHLDRGFTVPIWVWSYGPSTDPGWWWRPAWLKLGCYEYEGSTAGPSGAVASWPLGRFTPTRPRDPNRKWKDDRPT